MKEKVVINKKSKIKENLSIYVIVVGTILALYALSLIVPLILGFIMSLKERTEFIYTNVLSLPDIKWWMINAEENAFASSMGEAVPYPHYDNLFGSYTSYFFNNRVERDVIYRYGWNMEFLHDEHVSQGFLELTFNTILYSVVSTVISIMSPCIVAYLCAKFPNKFAGVLYTFVVVVMVMPIVGTGSATLTLMKKIRLHDTFWGLWIRNMSFTNMYFLIFYGYFRGLPDTYAEAAEIDGASYMRVMWAIYMPFAIKMISTTFLLQLVSAYNNYGINKLHLPSRMTLAYAAWELMNRKGVSIPERLGACYILSLPMLIFFVAFKNKLMGNITVGGLKG